MSGNKFFSFSSPKQAAGFLQAIIPGEGSIVKSLPVPMTFSAPSGDTF